MSAFNEDSRVKIPALLHLTRNRTPTPAGRSSRCWCASTWPSRKGGCSLTRKSRLQPLGWPAVLRDASLALQMQCNTENPR